MHTYQHGFCIGANPGRTGYCFQEPPCGFRDRLPRPGHAVGDCCRQQSFWLPARERELTYSCVVDMFFLAKNKGAWWCFCHAWYHPESLVMRGTTPQRVKSPLNFVKYTRRRHGSGPDPDLVLWTTCLGDVDVHVEWDQRMARPRPDQTPALTLLKQAPELAKQTHLFLLSFAKKSCFQLYEFQRS